MTDLDPLMLGGLALIGTYVAALAAICIRGSDE